MSKGRPQNLLKDIYKPIHSFSYWYVSSEYELASYFESIDELKINDNPFPRVVVGGKLIESRNAIIDDAKYFNKNYAVIIEDDLQRLDLALDKKNKIRVEIPQVIDMMVDYLDENPDVYMTGVAPTPNAFFYNPDEPISHKKFCVGSFLVIRSNTDLRFDPNLTLKEDYDYTLQHIFKYGKIARFNNILASFSHYSNKGGVVGYRNNRREQYNINYLKKKWGTEIIKDNPKRPNEILLKVK